MAGKLIVGSIIAAPVALALAITGLTATAGSVMVVTQPMQDDTSTVCVNMTIGNIPVDGLSDTAAANAVLITQTAMRKGLGREGAAIAIMAGLTESGLNPGDRGDNHSIAPQHNWSMGIYQTKLRYQMPEEWKKPGGGTLPDNDVNATARAMAKALDPQWQADWFTDRMVNAHALKNFKWRDAARFKDKPWLVAQYIENSAFKNGSNYRKTWNGERGYSLTPLQIVDTILAAGVDGSESAMYTTLTEAFPNLEIDTATDTFIIPNPNNTALSTNGYPVIGARARPSLLTRTSTANVRVPVAAWAKTVFNDLFTRWNTNPTLGSGRLNLSTAVINGHDTKSRASDGTPTAFASGTAVRIAPRNGKAWVATAEEQAAIESLVDQMGALIEWGGVSDPGTFTITANIGPDALDDWHATFNALGNPPYFVVGDSIGRSITRALEEKVSNLSVDAADGRGIYDGITILKKNTHAQAANTWIVELGTNNSDNPDKIREYVTTVMSAAGNRPVYWVNAYRPATHTLGSTLANNATLAELARTTKNLTIVDWYTAAAANPAWFAAETDQIHPNEDGKAALIDLVYAAITGNGNAVGATSVLCGQGNGMVANTDFVLASSGVKVIEGQITDNISTAIPRAYNAVTRARSFVGNPPCQEANCFHQCGQLSARVWGRNHSNYQNAKLQWEASIALGIATQSRNSDGTVNDAAFSIPIGALVYWYDVSKDGHVATYIGGGRVVTNYDGPKGYGVYEMNLDEMYSGYSGWALPIWQHNGT